MMRVPVETRAPRFRTHCAVGLLASLVASFAGCSGVVTQNSTSTPPPQGQTYTVSGTISPSAGGSGATVTLSGSSSASTTANSSGAYTFSGLANGSYAVTPSRSGYTFNPSSQTATVSGANVTGVNFTANVQSGQTYTISGTITPAAGGVGATVTLSGAANASTVTGGSGSYSFSGLTPGTYTVRPTNTGYSFNPTTRTATITGANVSGVDFTAVVGTAHSATATWTASSSSVAGYNVYRGDVSGGPYTKLNASVVTGLSYTDSTVISGQTYFYVATAMDASGNESVFSNEVKAVIP
jgi:hypothetical protein